MKNSGRSRHGLVWEHHTGTVRRVRARQGPLAALRHPLRPRARRRGHADRADRAGRARRQHLRIGERLQDHFHPAERDRVRAVRRGRHGRRRPRAPGGDLGDQERHSRKPLPECLRGPVHPQAHRGWGRHARVGEQPHCRRGPADRQYRYFPQHHHRPGRGVADSRPGPGGPGRRFRPAGGLGHDRQLAAEHLADHGRHVHAPGVERQLRKSLLLVASSEHSGGSPGQEPAEPSPREEFTPGGGWPPREPEDSPATGPEPAPGEGTSQVRGTPPWEAADSATGSTAAAQAPEEISAVAPDETSAAAAAGKQRVTGARARDARQAFRTWRHSRPFWGGLLLILAGVEMIAIPLLRVVAHNSVKVVIYIGIGGIFGVLIGGLLVTCGLLIWFHPVQRVFYAITGVLLSVASFVATNLGGFFIGMLLGVTGGSLSFGWTPGAGREQPGRPREADQAARAPQADEPSEGLGIVLRRDTGPGDHRRSGGRLMALAITPVIVSGLMLPGYMSGPMLPAASMRPAAQAGCIIPIPIICPPPSPSPTPSAAPGPTTGPSAPPGPILPVPVPTVPGAPGPAASGSAQPSRSPSASARGRAAAAPTQMASTAQSSLTADSAYLYGLSYDGRAQVATANGSVTMMKFSLSALTLSGRITLTVTQGGTPAVAQITQALTQTTPVPMTNVVTDQPYTTASSFQADGLRIGT